MNYIRYPCRARVIGLLKSVDSSSPSFFPFTYLERTVEGVKFSNQIR